MNRIIAGAAASAVALAACGKAPVEAKGDGTAVLHGANGDVTMTQSGAAPKNLPAYAPIFPGAKITSSVVTDAKTGSGGIVAYTVAATPAAVIDFYRKAAAKAQLTNAMSSPPDPDGSQVVLFNQANSQRSMSVSAKPADNKAGTEVGLTYGSP